MRVEDVRALRPELETFLGRFDACLGRRENRANARTYLAGLLSDLQRKSVEPIALAAGVAPRTLQEFLSSARWDHDALRARLQREVAGRHAHPFSVGVFDETSFAKKGRKTPGVQRQYCGSLGKIENCVVSVHLGYVAGDFRALIDGEVYLPEEAWSDDPGRRAEAGVPDGVVHKPKWEMALEQHRRAVGEGVRFRYVTFDEGYGASRSFLARLDGMGQDYVGEVPSGFRIWTAEPELITSAGPRRSGRPRKVPRLKRTGPRLCTAAGALRHSPAVRDTPWERYLVHDGSKGPTVWEVRRVRVWIPGPDGLPGKPHHLIYARNPLDPAGRVKSFVSNCAEGEPLENMLLAAHSRWRIEHLFRDAKDELGMDHFEARGWKAVNRHLLLTALALLFAAEFRERRGEKGAGADGRPGAHGGGPPGEDARRGPAAHAGGRGKDGGGHATMPTPQPLRRPEPPQEDAGAPVGTGHRCGPTAPLPMANVAL